MIDLLWVDGTWCGTGGSEVSEALRARVDGRKFRFRYVPYPGTFGPAVGGSGVRWAVRSRLSGHCSHLGLCRGRHVDRLLKQIAAVER